MQGISWLTEGRLISHEGRYCIDWLRPRRLFSYATEKERVTVSDDVTGIWREVILAKFKVLYQNFLRKTERNEELWTRRSLGRGLNLGRLR